MMEILNIHMDLQKNFKGREQKYGKKTESYCAGEYK